MPGRPGPGWSPSTAHWIRSRPSSVARTSDPASAQVVSRPGMTAWETCATWCGSACPRRRLARVGNHPRRVRPPARRAGKRRDRPARRQRDPPRPRLHPRCRPGHGRRRRCGRAARPRLVGVPQGRGGGSRRVGPGQRRGRGTPGNGVRSPTRGAAARIVRTSSSRSRRTCPPHGAAVAPSSRCRRGCGQTAPGR
jgi:hypothetical protein